MSSASVLLYWSSLISLFAYASPLVPRQTQSLLCDPDFPSDKPISIGHSQFISLSDGVMDGSGLIKATTAAFRFIKDNSFPPQWTISSFDDPSLTVGLRSNQPLFLSKQTTSVPKFLIDCNSSCGYFLLGDGCFITSASDANVCVQVGDHNGFAGASGDPLTLRPCQKNDSQRFNFFLMDRPSTTSKPVPSSTTVVDSTTTSTSRPNQCTPDFPEDEPVD